MTDPQAIVASGVAVAQAAGTLVPDTVRQVDKFGTDVAKTVRLLLFPFQIAGALQDRLEAYIDDAIRQIPQERRIEPLESVAFPIVEKLRFQPEGDPITELYIQLLSRAMDGERVGEAHPAFFSVITQLAPDELISLHDFASRDETLIMSPVGQKVYPDPAWRKSRLDKCELSAEVRQQVEDETFRYEALSQPELFPVYQEHLQHLGLIEYHNERVRHYRELELKVRDDSELTVFSMKVTHYGRLFLKACVKNVSSNGSTTDM
ncbi:Abi-alpha family protein [Agrobacterium sp.]|uniref:Abi-alpha family protein n=1 Tax=Agrobacterium sp. TaxID=361 RepID=UPI00289993FF|nr:Abi-alpha family protein [Agrobacterium sp.]